MSNQSLMRIFAVFGILILLALMWMKDSYEYDTDLERDFLVETT